MKRLIKMKEFSLKMKSITGSISLKGAIIDDLTFKRYNTTLENKKKLLC